MLVFPCREKSGARHPDWTGITGSCTQSQPPLQAVKHQPIHVHVSICNRTQNRRLSLGAEYAESSPFCSGALSRSFLLQAYAYCRCRLLQALGHEPELTPTCIGFILASAQPGSGVVLALQSQPALSHFATVSLDGIDCQFQTPCRLGAPFYLHEPILPANTAAFRAEPSRP